jgi:hypothetical protein
MEPTLFFAQLWGSYFIIFGSLFIITRQLGRTIEMTEDNNMGYREKNNAIWALGQLEDVRALTYLQKYYVGYDGKTKTKLDETLSQYELYKAIKLLDGGFNATAFLWR